MLGWQKKNNSISGTTEIKIQNELEIIERPRICCIDLNKEVTENLKKSGLNIYEGTLGAKVRLNYKSIHDHHQLLLNYHFPKNLHEYDVIIIDLDNFKTIDYNQEEHFRKNYTDSISRSILCTYPITLFDPRPFTSYLLNNKLKQIKKKFFMLVFATNYYTISYQPVIFSENEYRREEIQTHNIYSFWDKVPILEIKHGKEISFCNMATVFELFFNKFKKNITYNQTFYHPQVFSNGKWVNSDYFFPLIKNISDDIISYSEAFNNGLKIVLPQIDDKKNFLLEFLSNVAPSFFPELFPFSSKSDWKDQDVYWLPNHSELLKRKSEIEKEYEIKISETEETIKTNLSKYSFLHNMLIETGDNLVKSLIEYFKWLGFEDVIDHDKKNTSLSQLEEDIQIEYENGILIIECKGIGGTSTDSECSQISKIKHRRCKERIKFDVNALYIVNHQKYLPPLKRQNPPFSVIQIDDAKNDERGLLSTWQLFNLYFDIENGILTKEEARKNLLNYGLVEFKPNDISFIDEPTEFFMEGKVCIINIKNIHLNVKDVLYTEKNGRFDKVTILDIKENDKSISSALTGEFGLKFDKKIVKKTKLWKKIN